MSIEVAPLEFDAMVRLAIGRLPVQFRDALELVRVEVLDRPTALQLASVGLAEDELLLGLYDGVPLTLRSVQDLPHPPDVIYLFRHDLEDACETVEQLEEEVGITLFHELGHYFGFDEEELESLGYG